MEIYTDFKIPTKQYYLSISQHLDTFPYSTGGPRLQFTVSLKF